MNQTKKGSLMVVQADKGGALIIAPQEYVRSLVAKKLDDTSLYTNLGEEDPSKNAGKKLFDIWKKGEDKVLLVE